MKKVSGRSLFTVMALLSLNACGPYFVLPFGDPVYEIPIEVNFSESFLAAWDADYPLKAVAHFESHPAHVFTSEGHNPGDADVGRICSPTRGPVQVKFSQSDYGCVPREMSITVTIVPEPDLPLADCMRWYGGDSTEDGGMTSPPREDPHGPKPELTQTVKVKVIDCGLTEPVVFNF